MDGIINPRSQLTYPLSDTTKDAFMVVINLPPAEYDEIIAGIEQGSIEVTARLKERDRLESLFRVSGNTAQVYTTRISTPPGLDIENADAFYCDCVVTIYLPYF